MNCSIPGFPVHHQLPEFAQTHVHWVSDAIQQSHPRGLFQGVGSSHQVAKVLELQLQHQSFQWILSWLPLELTGLIFLLFKGLSRVFSRITLWKHRFFGTQPSLWSNSHIHTWQLEKTLWLYRPLLENWCLHFLIHCLGLSQLFF